MKDYLSKKKGLGIWFVVIFFIITSSMGRSIAQEVFPNRPVTVVCPWSAGMLDTVTRLLSKAAEKELGQPIIIENKAGAGGVIGLNYVLKSKPDGYTLVSAAMSPYFTIPHVRKVPYDPLTDMVDITGICKYNYGFAVRSDSPWKTYEDFVKYAKENPGKFSYSTAGAGNVQNICMERIAAKEGIKLAFVPFKSGGEAVSAVLGGHTNGVAQGSVDELPHIKAGTLRVLITLDDKRWPDLPNIPCMIEKGFDFYAFNYIGLSGPKGLPESIRQKLEDVFQRAKKDPSFMEAMNKFAVEANYLGGKEYSALWKSKYDDIGKAIKELGIQEK